MGRVTSYLTFSLVLPTLLLLALVDVAAAASPAESSPVYSVPYSPRYVTVTLPTPYPTPAPIITETITNTLQMAPFWNVDNWTPSISALQTVLMLPALQTVVTIIGWLLLMGLAFGVIRNIVTRRAGTGGPEL